MIEQDESSSVIIAATNHPEILDQALFRRFDDVIEYQLPTREQIRELVRVRLQKYLRSPKALDEIAAAADGLSHDAIVKAMDDTIKDAILMDENVVAPEALVEQFGRRQAMKQRGATRQTT